MTQLDTVVAILKKHGLQGGPTEKPTLCTCEHKLQGTGVFYQSFGLIYCPECKGWQQIRKPID